MGVSSAAGVRGRARCPGVLAANGDHRSAEGSASCPRVAVHTSLTQEPSYTDGPLCASGTHTHANAHMHTRTHVSINTGLLNTGHFVEHGPGCHVLLTQ